MPRSAAQRLVVHCGIFYSLLTGTIAGALRVFVHGPLKYCGRYCIPWTRCGVRAKRDQFPVRAKDVDGEQRYSQNCSFSGTLLSFTVLPANFTSAPRHTS